MPTQIIGSGNCLAGCISRYACNPVNLPPDWDTASPYVKIKFAMTGNEITVGNESAPCCDNKLIVKSFSYGFSNSYQIEVEIHDEEGGRFHEFIDIIAKCGPNMHQANFTMEAEFGWIMQTCGGLKIVKSNVTEGKPVRATVINLEVSYAKGKIKYQLTGNSTAEVTSGFREDKIIGADGQPICLRDAIVQLCAIPPVLQVDFLQRNRSGQPEPLRWKIGGTCGPKAVWAMDSQNKLATIAKWVEPFLTEKDKGVFITADESVHNKIVLWEDQEILCGESKTCGGRNLGTFIVNGGRCSNVIEFTPTFNWLKGMFKASSGGNFGSAASGKRTLMEDGKPCPENKHGANAGQESQITISRYAWDVHGPGRATQETGKSIPKHQHANKRYEKSAASIEGQLRIVGDPRKEFVEMGRGGDTLSIVAINPFHVAGNGNGGCGDWLAQPGCNQVLSNKSWMVMGCDHSIRDGFYETTIKVNLVAPDVDVDSNEPMGGSGSQGYVPRGTC